MNSATHPAMQAMQAAYATVNAARPRPNHDFSTTTGEGCAIVDCQFNVSDEGDVEDLIVEFNGINVLPVLTEEQVMDLEYACYQNYLKECDEAHWDARIAAWEDRS